MDKQSKIMGDQFTYVIAWLTTVCTLCLQFQVQWKDSALWTTDGLNFCWDHTEKVLLSLFKLRE